MLALHIVTRKVVTVSSLQLSAVVLPPNLLRMVSEVSLVQRMGPQGTTCKERADVPAWPMDGGVGGYQLAVVSPLERSCYSVKTMG